MNEDDDRACADSRRADIEAIREGLEQSLTREGRPASEFFEEFEAYIDDTVAAFRPTEEIKARVLDLIARERTTGLEPEEKAELDRFLRIEPVMRIVKASTVSVNVHDINPGVIVVSNRSDRFSTKPWIDRWDNGFPDTPEARDRRTDFRRDCDRIVHAPCFRRLQAKVQVLDSKEGDYHRTRLTHTLEVAKIARGIVDVLSDPSRKDLRAFQDSVTLDADLIEAICYAHDIGHPPFGHAGEIALQYTMANHGGFEGNAQSLRQIVSLENGDRVKTKEFGRGLRLTRRTLLGVLKYPVVYERARTRHFPRRPCEIRMIEKDQWHPPKCYYSSEDEVVKWISQPVSNDWEYFTALKDEYKDGHRQTRYKSVDCWIMDLADEIAYSTHDLEDGIALGLIKRNHWDTLLEREAFSSIKGEWESWRKSENRSDQDSFDQLEKLLFSESSSTDRRHAVSRLFGGLIHNVQPKVQCDELSCGLLRWKVELPPDMERLRKFLHELVETHVINSQGVQTLEYRARIMLVRTFEAIQSDPRKLLKDRRRREYEEAGRDVNRQMRVICDYIAGMTDAYATRFYNRLFVPGQGSAFDIL